MLLCCAIHSQVICMSLGINIRQLLSSIVLVCLISITHNTSANKYTGIYNDVARTSQKQNDVITIWSDREKYYYNDLSMKMKHLVVYGNCSSNFKQIPDNTIQLPQQTDIYISVFPVNDKIQLYWKNMKRPRQHRVDPYICEAVYLKRLPIFNNTRLYTIISYTNVCIQLYSNICICACSVIQTIYYYVFI